MKRKEAPMKDFKGKRALITGGARGIGFAIATELAREGVEIVLTDLKDEDLAKAKERLGRSARCSTYTLDVTDTPRIAAVRDLVHKDLGRVDILVNNAGLVFGGPFLDVPLEKHLLTYKINVEAVVAMTWHFLADLIGGTEGHLVNMASASGLVPLPKGSTYASSKWAVIGFSESIRVELKRRGAGHVGVTTVSPSFVSTGMFEGVKAPRLVPWITPERVAKHVLAAMKANKPAVMEPFMVKLVPAIMGTLPAMLTDRVSDLLGVSSSMEEWRGHGAS
jgi:short-subunit dehydrogenase